MHNTASFIRNIVPLGLSQLITWACTAALVVVLPQHLGDANLGKVGIALALITLVTLAADLGAPAFLTREVARDPVHAMPIIANTLVMRIPLVIVAIVAAIASAHIAGYDDLTKAVVYVLCPYLAIDALGRVVFASIQGMQRMRLLALSAVVGKVVFAVLAVAMLITGYGGPVEVGALFIIGALPALAVAVVALLRTERWTFKMDWPQWRVIFLGGMPFFTWQAAATIYGQLNVLMLSVMATSAVIGWYGAASRLIMMPIFVPNIVATIAFPALSAASRDVHAYSAMAERALRSVLLLAVPMSLGIMMLPYGLIELFHYPESFTNSAPLIVLLAPCLALMATNTIVGTVLSTRNKQKQWAMVAVAAAILNPTANLLTIPYMQATYGNGAMASATIATLTELFLLVVGFRLLPRDVFGRETLVYGLKCVAAGVVMAGFVWLARDYPIAIPIAIGAAIYGVASLSLGTVSVSNAREVVAILMSKANARTTLRVEPHTEGV